MTNSLHLGRRGLLAAAGCAALVRPAVALPVPTSGSISFRVLRNDSPIGKHVLTFSPSGNTLTVRVIVDIAVGFCPLTFFRYTHRAEERWEDGTVVSLDAETNDAGTVGRTMIRRVPEGYSVEGRTVPRYIAPANALPATHWNRRMLDGPLINTQNGLLMRPTIKMLGPGQVPTADGGSLHADHVTLRGDADLDTWYDATPAWVGLRFTAKDGSVVEYRRG